MDFNLVQAYILKLPEVNDLKITPQVKEIINKYSDEIVEEYLKKIIDRRHKEIISCMSQEELQRLDFSFDFYIECLKKELVVEKGRPFKKVINCMGTIYSEYIGERFYSNEVIKNFEDVFKGYNNLELDEEKSQKVEIDAEIRKLFMQFSGEKDFIMTNNIGAALHLVVNTLFNDKKVIMGISDSLYLQQGMGFQDIITKAGGNLKTVGYINRIKIEDYLKEIETKEELIIYSDLFENNRNGIGKLSQNDIFQIKDITNTLYITNRVYKNTNSDEIKSIGINFEEILLKNFGLYIFEFSKLAGGPDIGIITGKKQFIDKIRANFMTKILSPSKEIKVLFYFTLKSYLEKRYNEIYINKCLSLKEETLKEKNRRFVRNLEREIGKKANINITRANYLFVDDKFSAEYSFERELVYIKPIDRDAAEIEKLLRINDPSILCWLNEGMLIFNLQLVSENEEDIIMDKLSKII